MDLNDSVSTWVTRVATSVAGCPIQSTTSPTCGSERSGTASRDSDRRAPPPQAAPTIPTAVTIQLWRGQPATRPRNTAPPPPGSPSPPPGPPPPPPTTCPPPPPPP